jgi:hypothetical protein
MRRDEDKSEMGCVRTVCGRGKLATGSETVCHETLKEDRVDVRARKVYSSGVSCRT